jgi:uncharacterized cysteine cluster protein YcgN (CxxCxxCC family)
MTSTFYYTNMLLAKASFNSGYKNLSSTFQASIKRFPSSFKDLCGQCKGLAVLDAHHQRICPTSHSRNSIDLEYAQCQELDPNMSKQCSDTLFHSQ